MHKRRSSTALFERVIPLRSIMARSNKAVAVWLCLTLEITEVKEINNE